ncbi:MAG: site-specific integrase [Actinomycetota bacterium]
MAHIRKLDANRWQARYRGPDGREHARNFSRKTDAERFLTTVESAKLRGEWLDPKGGRTQLNELYSSWRATSVETGTHAPSTLAKWDDVWRHYVQPRLGARTLASITRDDVKTMVASIRSPWQATEALKLTRLLLNRALDAEIIGRNVAARVSAPRTDRTAVRVLEPGELAAVADALPLRWRALVLLGAYSSLRWSELVAVRRDDLDLERRTVRVDEKLVEVAGRFEWRSPKTEGSARTVDLPLVAVRPVAEHLLRFPPLRETEPRLEGLVFYGEGGGPVRRHVFRPIWRRACNAAGVEPIRLEWLRHTGASLAYAATHDLKATAERLGHTSTRMVDTTYVRLYEDATRDVADAIDALVERGLSRTSRGFSADS